MNFIDPEVQCAFCSESSKDEYKLKKLGPFYGPVKKGGHTYYFHELCALWSPDIHLTESGKLKNLHKDIKRSKACFCAYCSRRGGGLKCNIKKCDNSYHVLCAKSEGCLFDDQNYNIYCPEHKNSLNPEIMEKIFVPDDAASDYSDMVCFVCKSGLDEDKILICDNRTCGKGVHTYCNVPEILEIPGDEEMFFCFNCS